MLTREQRDALTEVCAALSLAIRILETTAELTAGTDNQARIDAKLPELRAALAKALGQP